MAKKRPTKAEREYMSKVAELGCFICHAPAEIHHKTGAGMGLKSSNYDVIPLCPNHHRGNEGIHQIGKITWEEMFGTQEGMIKRIRSILDESMW